MPIILHLLSFYAFFTVWCHIAVFAEWSFKVLAHTSFLPFLLAIGYYFFWKNKEFNKELYNSDISRKKYDNILITCTVVFSLAICIFSVRYESDEAFYSSIETYSIEYPELPLLKYDGMFGESEKPILHLSYKVQSYQVLSAVISYWVGIPPPLVRHTFFPVVATFLFIFIWIRILQLFIPENWQLGLCIFILFLIFAGGYRGITNYSIVRFYDGKCLLAFIIIPLLYYRSILYFRQPTLANWCSVIITQIAGIGLSSSAIFLLPLQTLIISLAYWRPNYNQIRYCALFGASCLYIVIIGLILKLKMDALDIDILGAKDISLEFYMNMILPNIRSAIGGTITTQIFSIVSIFSIWFFLPKECDLRTLCVVILLTMIFIIINPIFAPLFANLTSKWVYWRLIYILPVPLFIVVTVVGVIDKAKLYFTKEGDFFSILAFMFMFFISPYLIYTHPFKNAPYSWNITHYFSPRFEPIAYKVAETIRDNTPPNTRALAPSTVSMWIAGMSHAPKLIAVNHAIRRDISYLTQMASFFDTENVTMRQKMHHIISGTVNDFDPSSFFQWLKALNVGSVTFKEDLSYHSKLRSVLKKAGYKNIGIYNGYIIWAVVTGPTSNTKT